MKSAVATADLLSSESCDQMLILTPLKEVDPFSHQLNPSWMDILQITIMSFTIVPIRSLCILILLIFGWLLAIIGLISTTPEQRLLKPFNGWRKRLQNFLRMIFRAIFFCMGFHRIKVRGTQVRKYYKSIRKTKEPRNSGIN